MAATRGRKPEPNSRRSQSLVLVRTGEVDALPRPPEELTEGGLAVWDVLLPDLIKLNMFQASDGIILVELCETLASAQVFRREASRLQEQLEEADAEDTEDAEARAERISGRLKRARSGYLQSMKLVNQLSSEFGVSPVARLRLGLMRVQGATLLGSLMQDDE